MRKVRRTLAFLLTAVIVASNFAGCGDNSVNNNDDKTSSGVKKTKIEISYWHAGMGIEWLDNMIAAFETKYPEYDVVYDASSAYQTFIASFGLEDVDKYDLYFGTYTPKEGYLVSLDDVLDTTVEGESISIREKFKEEYLANEVQQDGHVYSITSGGGIYGVVYNKEMFEDAGITQLPRTTDELESVAQTFADNGTPAFCHFSKRGYWDWLAQVWSSQYDGYDYYRNTLYGNPTKEVLKTKDGRYEALKALEKLVTPEYTLAGSNTGSHIAMQTRFANGKVAMMVTGSWMALEMNNEEVINKFAMMRTPVISSITDKLTTVTNEATLRNVIDAIDNVTDGTESVDKYKSGDNYVVGDVTVSATDWDYIKEARNSYASTYAGLASFIPTYSENIEGAKTFLKFFYSDEGYKIYTDATHVLLPFSMSEGTVDTSDWNEFEKNQVELITKVYGLDVHKDIKGRHKLWNVGLEFFAGQNIIGELCATNAGDRKTADQIWETMMKVIDADYDGWEANIK